ncbi:hypothetical protein PIB30_009538 [Stylosanthes scabra]|uniref:Uncharacterized protein n=1 Tax=Stylosanthes scabra TaxID=79078 RepID=A0ABU6Z3U9_9FABA|nr:hypothetical protein [Stylosanthes scabra]
MVSMGNFTGCHSPPEHAPPIPIDTISDIPETIPKVASKEVRRKLHLASKIERNTSHTHKQVRLHLQILQFLIPFLITPPGDGLSEQGF